MNAAILDANYSTVSRAERARLLLSICAVLLLLGAAYALFRLQTSYRELNQSNADLELANLLLEERVAARTDELSHAFDDLKESQTQLIHAEKMSSLGQMVAGISHEINTPLWYLMSNSTVIQERLELVTEFCEIAKTMIAAVQTRSSVTESVRQGLVDMHRLLKDGMEDDIVEAKGLIQDSIFGLEELTALAQGLKDFSRLDRAVYGEYDVNDGLDKALLIASNKIKNRVNVHKYYRDVPSIYCSPSQINQIFLNLLTNAADAIEGSGELVIQTWEENGNVGISIADTGSGIAEDVLPNIRDPFFTTKEIGKGTGLGLSIVDKIISTHRGELGIESKAGEGTTVTVLLPISNPSMMPVEYQEKRSEPNLFDVEPMLLSQNGHELPDDTHRLLSA
jgi:signal transduction histidine kinase